MNYKEAFYELKSLFDDVPSNGALAPIKDVASRLAEKAESSEKAEEARQLEIDKQTKVNAEQDPFKKISMKYMTPAEIAKQETKLDPFQAAADKYK